MVQMVPSSRPNAPRPRYDLDEPANGELADFCEAMDEASQKRILRNAFSEYRDRMLKENDGIRRRYEQCRARRQLQS
jgi:hypothetical protein